MPAPRRYRSIRRLALNVESDMLKEFEDLCWNERKSVTDKINELIEQTVRGNGKDALAFALGNGNGNGHTTKHQQPSQYDIRLWIPYKNALEMVRDQVRKQRLDTKEQKLVGETLQIIGRKLTTGYLDRN